MKQVGMLLSAMLIMFVCSPAWGGSITGSVLFTGDVPEKEKFTVAKDPETCGSGKREMEWVRVVDGKLSRAVVYIDKIDSSKDWPAETSLSRINQQNCAFDPPMQVIRNGAEIEVMNSDPVLHNIHTYELIGRAMRTLFNVNQPQKGSFRQTVNLKRGRWLKLGCDAHDFMHAWVFVANNPYYSVTGDDGAFNITDVPPGEYKLIAYHPSLGKQRMDVTVGGDASRVEFVFSGK